MKHRLTHKLPVVVILIITLAAGGSLGIKTEAQGAIRLRQPFADTYRLTAYVDHRSPDYTYDSNIVVYNGEERLDCPDCGEAWTTQGPYCYDGHNGTDYALPGSTSVLAAGSGEVTFRGWRSDAYGNSIRIDHGSGYQTWYCHMAGFSVNLNDEVMSGQQIGLSGNTGQNQPYHLHFEVRHNSNVTDPFGWRGDWSDPLSETATCLWGDGQCSEFTVEDESDWFYKSGTGWDWDCHGNGWTMRLVANKQTSESAYARWRPDLPYAGPYAVFAFVPAVHATTTNARYTIHDKDGDHTIPISQLDYSDVYIYWGSYDFWDGTFGYVDLNNATDESDGSTDVSFDSIKFRQFRVYLPVVAP